VTRRIRREETRLRAVFQRILVLSVAVAPAACSSAAPEGEANDASATRDATQASLADGTTAAPDVAEGAISDGGDSSDATLAGDAADGVAARDALDRYGFLDSACDPQYEDGASDSGCDFYERLPCGIPPNSATERCFLTITQCGTLCNQEPTLARVCGVSECLVVDGSAIPDAAPLTLECATGLVGCQPGVGRRPAGLAAATPVRRGDAVGAMLAEMAHLEAASVHAFRRLGIELASMRAPRALVRRAERSARDEVRHARVTARLARRRGAKAAPVVLERRRPLRSLVDFAVENAVEGCVRECFGALVATRQAARARDPEVAREMGRIARDETRHAALAWEIARWLAPRLDADARERVEQARRAALASLRCEVALTPRSVARALGLPTGAEAQRLVDAFSAALG
jgi:hypothetical protein